MTTEQIAEMKQCLDEIRGGYTKMKDLPGACEELKTEVSGLRKEFDKIRKSRLSSGMVQPKRKGWVVSPDCARHLAAVAIIGAERHRKLSHLSSQNRDWVLGRSAEIIGLETKAALSSSDIPLPVDYQGEVVELVFMYGLARELATLFPLGAGTVKLPKLSSDPTFGFVQMSGSISEKSPQVSFVQFDAQKAGGLVRIPSELDEDSIVPIGQFIARYGARNLARWEDTVFFNADGSGTYNNLSGVCKHADTQGKKVQLATTKTKPSDITLADWRNLRAQVNGAALSRASYCMHPTMEALLSTYNTSTYMAYRNEGGRATLEGFPITWVPVLPVYDTSAHAGQYQATFGDLEYWYFGERGTVRVDVSNEVYFATDEIGVRFIEGFVPKPMADDANAVLQLAGS